MKKITYSLSLVVLLCLTVFFLFKGKSVGAITPQEKVYLSLWEEVFALEKEIVNSSIFTVDEAIDKRFRFLGTTPKHIFLDQDGQKWLFKMNSLIIAPIVAEKVSQLLRICGFDTPLFVTKTFQINNKKYFGSFQHFLDIEKEVWNVAQLVTLPKDIQANVFGQEIITYIFSLEDEFLLGRDGNLYFTDLNNILLFPKDSKRPPYGEFLKISPDATSMNLGPQMEAAFEGFHAGFQQPPSLDICKKWTDLYPFARQEDIDGIGDIDVSVMDNDLIQESLETVAFVDRKTENLEENQKETETVIWQQSRLITKELHLYYLRKGINSLSLKTAKTLNFVSAIPDSYFANFLKNGILADSQIYNKYMDTVLSRKQNLKKIFGSFYKVMPFYKGKDLIDQRYTDQEMGLLIKKLDAYKASLEAKLRSLRKRQLKQPEMAIFSSPEAKNIHIAARRVMMISDDVAVANLKKLLKNAATPGEKAAIQHYLNKYQ